MNKNGLTSLIIKSKMINSSELAEKRGIDVTTRKYETKEMSSIGP